MAHLALVGGNPITDGQIMRWPRPGAQERENLLSVFDSGQWWRMDGHWVHKFERAFAAYHCVAHGLAVTNGTQALELVLRATGLTAGDEVIVPAFTSMSVVTAVLRAGAVPVPADVSRDTLNLDPGSAEDAVTGRTRGLIVVHMAGHPAPMDELSDIAVRRGLWVIEDAAHAHGAEYRGVRIGGFGLASVFSFQATKLITSGEGGAILTGSHLLLDRVRLEHHGGRVEDRHEGAGTNCRMTEFQAAILYPQLDLLDERNLARGRAAGLLDGMLAGIPGLASVSRRPEATCHSYYMYLLWYDRREFAGVGRDLLVRALRAEGIPAYPAYGAVHRTELMAAQGLRPPDHSLRVAEAAATDCLWIHHGALAGREESVALVAKAFDKIHSHRDELRAQGGK